MPCNAGTCFLFCADVVVVAAAAVMLLDRALMTLASGMSRLRGCKLSAAEIACIGVAAPPPVGLSLASLLLSANFIFRRSFSRALDAAFATSSSIAFGAKRFQKSAPQFRNELSKVPISRDDLVFTNCRTAQFQQQNQGVASPVRNGELVRFCSRNEPEDATLEAKALPHDNGAAACPLAPRDLSRAAAAALAPLHSACRQRRIGCGDDAAQ